MFPAWRSVIVSAHVAVIGKIELRGGLSAWDNFRPVVRASERRGLVLRDQSGLCSLGSCSYFAPKISLANDSSFIDRDEEKLNSMDDSSRMQKSNALCCMSDRTLLHLHSNFLPAAE